MKILMFVCLALFSLAGFADEVVPVDKVKDSINVRAKPETGSEIVGQLKQGTSLPLLESLDGWYKVQLEADASGFVSADWARVVAVADENLTVAAEIDAAASAEDSSNAAVEELAKAADERAQPEVADEPVATTEAIVKDVEPVVEGVEKVGETVVEANLTEQGIVQPAGTEPAPDEAVEIEVVKEAPATATLAPTVVAGPAGPPGPPGAANIKGTQNYLVKFKKEAEGGNSQIFDNGNQVGIGTTEPKQRLEVNGSIQIHEQNSSVAGLMITQSSGETGYIMHNRASTLTIGAGSQDRLTIDRNGNVGIGVSRPGYPLELASGAHVTAGGVWTNSSSRDKKENIVALSSEQAIAALLELEPVSFNYRNERQESYVGFIAEDVPDLLASRDRQTLSAMDVVAVLTKVVQAQQQQIEELEARLNQPSQRR